MILDCHNCNTVKIDLQIHSKTVTRALLFIYFLCYVTQKGSPHSAAVRGRGDERADCEQALQILPPKKN